MHTANIVNDAGKDGYNVAIFFSTLKLMLSGPAAFCGVEVPLFFFFYCVDIYGYLSTCLILTLYLVGLARYIGGC